MGPRLKASWAPRNGDQSSSPFGQFVHDRLPTTFYAADIDLVCYARVTKILRLFESKHPGQSLKPSQRQLLPMFAAWVEGSVRRQKIAVGSGVFVVWFDEDRETCSEVRQVAPTSATLLLGPPLAIGGIVEPGSELGQFIACRTPIPDLVEAT